MEFEKFDEEEFEENKKRNRKERIEFIRKYVEWLKKTPNKKWSKIHAKFLK
jgi:crotonobetainyl-CoA:carnitine CoA-transferase CaiB-like acyl-CoA transferase